MGQEWLMWPRLASVHLIWEAETSKSGLIGVVS